MEKLSPHYRNDQANGLSAEIRAYLDEHFLGKLEHLHAHNPKLLVVFSGGNGVGKSSLSARIQRDLQGLVLENDRIKFCLLDRNPKYTRDELSTLTWQYTMDLYSRLPAVTSNGLVVRDGVIDWYYDRILPVFEKQGYPLFVIGYEVSPKKRIELIRNRGDKPTIDVNRYLELFEDHAIHTARFRKHHPLDVVLRDENLFEYDSVIAKIRERLAAAA